MRIKSILFIVFGCVCASAQAGFLQPVGFPKTAADLSFVDRIKLKRAGYEPFDTVYDANGNCISGCAYAQPKLEDELAAMQRWDNLVRQELTAAPIAPIAPAVTAVSAVPVAPIAEQVPVSHPFPHNCSEFSDAFVNRDIPFGNPLGVITCITSPYGARTLNGQTRIHYGIDFRASIGTNVYAPANGTVASVVNDATCGKGVVITHSYGYSTVYCHLSEILVESGKFVNAGCLIAKTGNTGRSTGPHLHYGVKKNGNSVNPIYFIESGHSICGI